MILVCKSTFDKSQCMLFKIIFSRKGSSLHSAILERYTAQKMKFSIKDFFSNCDQIRRNLRIWSHLMKKSLMENFIFCAVLVVLNLLKSQPITFSKVLQNAIILWSVLAVESISLDV